MKFETSKLTKVIEQNYSHLMPDFFEMQTEYLASLNIIYNDLDASLIGMVLTSQIYKNTLNENGSYDNISLENFYKKENLYCLYQLSKLKKSQRFLIFQEKQ